MIVLRTLLEILYVSALLGLALYGLHNAVTVFLYWKTKDHPLQPTPMADWPVVTVQLPIFNERYTVERLLSAVAALDYPREKLHIQVLDDSTDDTAILVRHLVEQWRARGYDMELIQRSDRSGFKAGALAEGMKTAKGDLLAIFDADFVPPADWLKKTVIYFGDPQLACLQTRWGHTNASNNLLTRAQSLGIDGHFIIEQTARSRNGLFLNFNGTAGIWRKSAIEDAGGWQPDTLTEDLDLSYRVQLKGWRIDYLPDVVVPAELPPQVEAFKKQQYRWAKGSFQVVRKMFLRLLTADLPEGKRILGLLHITGYFVHPLMLAILLLILPIGLMSPSFLRMFPWTMVTAFGPPLLYLVARTEYHPRLTDRLRILPVLILVGFGLSLNNSLAVLEGLFSNKTGTFTRTPKFNVTDQRQGWAQSAYAVRISPMVWGEIGLGCYALVSLVVLLPHLGWKVAPWLLIYAAGYFYLAGMNLVQNWQTAHLRSAEASMA
jgi:cellulose synthase/poly-beta-1,6-N-acetylglucosamine synthase-like glycosyltransferase